jgi:4-methyl-5(b-hydroxyethyl)-thiazole monophosphate biosynthesis
LTPPIKQILVPLANGFEEIEAITIIDVLRRAGLTVRTTSLTTDRSVIGAHGVAVSADASLSSMADYLFDAVVLPGGMPGATNLAQDPVLKDILLRHQKSDRYLAAICAAPTVLAKHGLLKGKRATAYPGFEEQLTGATVKHDDVVTDGRVVTSRGPGTAMAFAICLVEVLLGALPAQKIKDGLLFS